MGILNVTPDSFSDGGLLPTAAAVAERAVALVREGADVLDVGGESTRPGAPAVSEAVELSRVLPAIRAIREVLPDVPVSIDTYKAPVARAAVEAGADIINDVWGAAFGFGSEERKGWREAGRARASLPALRPSPMATVAAETSAPLILTHNRPDRHYVDFWEDVLLDLRFSLMLAVNAGIEKRQLWLDPGFGFAKEPGHNLEVLRQLSRIVALGYPVLLGTSRKSTLGLVSGSPVGDRLDATAASLVWGIQQGASMVRVHDVGAMARTVRVADALRAGLNWKP